MPYFLGIDNGGTMTKSALFDEKGKEIASAAVDTPLITPKDGYNERDMLALWEATAMTIRQTIEKSGIDSSEIAGIGCTGHGKGLYLWGKDNVPAYHAIASTDHRAAEIVEKWVKDGISEQAKKKTLQDVRDCQPAALLHWFKENKPEVYENIRWVFEAKDYIRFMLTGEAFAEVTDYSGTSLLNLVTKTFDQELLKVFDIEEVFSCLPPLKYSFEHCGVVTKKTAAETGLSEGTLVCGGMFDIDACAVAMDVISEDKLCVITGTWSINEYISKTPVTSNNTTLNSIFAIPEYYLIEESSPTSAGNLEWVADTLLSEVKEAKGKKELYQMIDSLAESISPEDSNVLFLPFLYGSNSSYKSGAFLNLSNKTTKDELLRAVFEGVAFSHKMHIDRLLSFRDEPKAIRIAGGAVKSKVWLQIFADIWGYPLEVIETKELGALGSAMAAAVCSDVYENYAEAAKSMVRLKETVIPNAENREAYLKKYAEYSKLLNKLGDEG